MIEIKRRTDGHVLYMAENAADVKSALEEAVKKGADLGFADLRSADLRSADLRSADLRSADLRFADLRFADLRFADLRFADLRFADLGFADLRSADLRSADLGSALGHGHPLWAFQADFLSVLDRAPAEVAGLRQALVDGRVDGSVYEGECACLVGTIANVRRVSIVDLEISQDASRPAEIWFLPIREGDVPIVDLSKCADSEGVFRASVAVKWIDLWAESRHAISRTLAEAAA